MFLVFSTLLLFCVTFKLGFLCFYLCKKFAFSLIKLRVTISLQCKSKTIINWYFKDNEH